MEIIVANEERKIRAEDGPMKQLPRTILGGEFGCCIYRVPKRIRQENEELYAPRVVSIGPFHHGGEILKSMEEYKLRCLRKFLGRSNVSLESYVESMKDCEGRARSCYEGNIEMCSTDFLGMMLVDGCFIIELMMSSYLGEDDSVFSTPRVLSDVYKDLILLENQLPFFFLERLFSLSFANFPRKLPSLLDLSINFFGSHNHQNKVPSFRSSSDLRLKSFRSHNHKNKARSFRSSPSSVKHFTDLIRALYLPMTRGGPRDDDVKYGSIVKLRMGYSATQLQEAGVRFNVGPSKCLLDIQFSNGVLEIPCFNLYNSTECIIKNLMALELCHYPNDSYINDYVVFMDTLINSPRDVDLLVESGILANWLGGSNKRRAGGSNKKRAGSSTTTDHIMNLFKPTVISAGDSLYFSDLCGSLDAYCNKFPRRRWRRAAALRRDLFVNPRRSAFTLAIFLLVLSFVQTLLSILSLAHGRRRGAAFFKMVPFPFLPILPYYVILLLCAFVITYRS